jgi:nitroreductase
MASVREAIEQRRSIRKFKADEVPEDSLRELLEAARLAPSGSNS